MELAPVPIVSAFRRASVRLPGSVHTLLYSRRLRSTVVLLALIVLISLPLQWLVAREVFALIYRGRGPLLLQAIMKERDQLYPLDYYNGRLDAVFSLWAMIVVVSTAYLVALTWPLTALRQHPLVYRLSGLREQVARVELLWVVLGAATLSLLATVPHASLRSQALRWGLIGSFSEGHTAIIDGESLAPN